MNTFQTKSRAIELLGRKQIRDGITALIEMIKNAYDADAEWCNVIFNTKYKVPYIMISDSGCGMSQDDILHKWLVIGTESKRKRKRITPKKHRTLMGEKGIGRLAASILGQQLLLITKSESDGKWNILFLDWNTFENQFAFLSDISIGLEMSLNYNSLNSLSNIVKNMVMRVRSNIYRDCWHEKERQNIHPDLIDLHSKIDSQLNNYDIHLKRIMNQINLIENNGGGTLLYITNLHDKWENILDTKESSKDKQSDYYRQNNYQRLNAFIYPMNQGNNQFKIKVWNNDEEVYFSYGFSDDDFEIFDIKIEGRVDKGYFYGSLDVLNADENLLDECNRILSSGIDLTQGMSPETIENGECGSYSIKFCHIEGQERLTSLNSDVWQAMTKKLETCGGVYVYRDDVRILPYGEKENDFLQIEERRSRGAGYYIFSHRRFFGRVDISSKNNPLLEDKSSREGLIENIQFYFFIETLKNLLKRIAVEFLNGMGIRDSYANYNKQAFEMQKKEAEDLKRQQEEIKSLISYIKQQLKENPVLVKKFINELNKQNGMILNEISSIQSVRTIAGVSLVYNRIKSMLNDYYRKIKYLSGLAVKVPDKYLPALDEETGEALVQYNAYLSNLVQDYNKSYMELKDNALNRYNSCIENLNKLLNEVSGTDLKQCKIVLSDSINMLKSRMNNISNNLNHIINEKYENIGLNAIKLYVDDKSKNIDELRNKLLFDINQNEINLKSKIGDISNRINFIDNIEPEKFISWFKQITYEIDGISGQLGNYENQIALKVENEFSSSDKELKIMKDLIDKDFLLQGTTDALTKRNIILERENEILTDLANVGLAAEVVDHEFNQYFTNVTNAISRLKVLSLQPTAKYLLEQIDTGFRAISNRHSQLSPMYRSYNYKRKDHRVIDVVHAVTNFYSTSIVKNSIKVQFDIDEDDTIFISTSKIYPALSNLLNNAIYWAKSKGEKLILWRFDCKKHSLYIEDTGPGIPERLKDKSFELFFSLKPSGTGRGMGLYLTKKILESEGHAIDIVYDINEKRLNGACFRITFREGNK